MDKEKLYFVPFLKGGYNFPKLFTIKINIDKLYNNVRKIIGFNKNIG